MSLYCKICQFWVGTLCDLRNTVSFCERTRAYIAVTNSITFVLYAQAFLLPFIKNIKTDQFIWLFYSFWQCQMLARQTMSCNSFGAKIMSCYFKNLAHDILFWQCSTWQPLQQNRKESTSILHNDMPIWKKYFTHVMVWDFEVGI